MTLLVILVLCAFLTIAFGYVYMVMALSSMAYDAIVAAYRRAVPFFKAFFNRRSS